MNPVIKSLAKSFARAVVKAATASGTAARPQPMQSNPHLAANPLRHGEGKARFRAPIGPLSRPQSEPEPDQLEPLSGFEIGGMTFKPQLGPMISDVADTTHGLTSRRFDRMCDAIRSDPRLNGTTTPVHLDVENFVGVKSSHARLFGSALASVLNALPEDKRPSVRFEATLGMTAHDGPDEFHDARNAGRAEHRRSARLLQGLAEFDGRVELTLKNAIFRDDTRLQLDKGQQLQKAVALIASHNPAATIRLDDATFDTQFLERLGLTGDNRVDLRATNAEFVGERRVDIAVNGEKHTLKPSIYDHVGNDINTAKADPPAWS